MSSVQLPLNIHLMEEESRASTDITRRIHMHFVKNKKIKGDRKGNHIK